MNDAIRTDILVIGSGLGGLAAAWNAANRGCNVTLLTRASNPQDSNTYRAQGGIIYQGHGEAPEQLVAGISRHQIEEDLDCLLVIAVAHGSLAD